MTIELTRDELSTLRMALEAESATWQWLAGLDTATDDVRRLAEERAELLRKLRATH